MARLELYNSVKSEVVKDCSKNENDIEETNQASSYLIKIKLDQDIPKSFPISERWIKIYYNGILKLCTNCFGKHQRRICHSRKVQRIQFVGNFVSENPNIPDEYYGK
jgi:adenine specific DNA methylase Mod